jgi:hypothetical protein
VVAGVPRRWKRIRFRRRSHLRLRRDPEGRAEAAYAGDAGRRRPGAIKEQMAETIEKAKADDPELRSLRNAKHETAPVVERVEVPALGPDAMARLAAVVDVAGDVAALRQDVEALMATLAKRPSPEPATSRGTGRLVPRPEPQGAGPAARRRSAEPGRPPGQAGASHPQRSGPVPTRSLAPPAGPPDRLQREGVDYRRGPLDVAEGRLRRALGRSRASDAAGPRGPSSARSSRSRPGRRCWPYWRGQLGKRERLILDVLVQAWPGAVEHATICEATGYSPEASTVGAGLSKLRALELVDGWALSADFAAATGLA